jgi:hypothetical protein
MKLANVLVAARLGDGSNLQGHLPATRAIAEINDNIVTISTEDSSSLYFIIYLLIVGLDMNMTFVLITLNWRVLMRNLRCKNFCVTCLAGLQ